MKKLLLATNNPGKRREFQELLRELPIELLIPSDIGLSLDVDEDGKTYVENALKKARAFSEASGLPSLADDSGLEVDALSGAPGLYSARYLNQRGATDADRRAHLIENLRGKPRPWTARFRAAVVLARAEAKVEITEGACPGQVIPEERGKGGFGYDAIFLLDELPFTMAELSEEQKNRLSHRARAVAAMMPVLGTL